MTTNHWLEIDLKGFSQILHSKGIARILLEPISNAFDTQATEVDVAFDVLKGWATLTVTDNDPDGFADLRESYTLYAPSRRRDDPEKRGRYGLGEKELLAICSQGGKVAVSSTTGTVHFDKNGRRKGRVKTDRGTFLTAEFRCTAIQAAEFEDLVGYLLPPPDLKLTFNGIVIQNRLPVNTSAHTLATVITDIEGNLTSTRRKTTVQLYEPVPSETPHIYELGIPVVEHDGRFHVNVGQKVPLNVDRDNVTPAYLRRLREIVLNETFDILTEVDQKSAWVKDALPNATPEALRAHVERIHGKDAVIFDPHNPEASKRAVDEGRTIVYGRQFTAETWSAIKKNEILKPAGQVIETSHKTDPNGEPPIPHDQWSGDMVRIADYTALAGGYLLGFQPTVEFIRIGGPGTPGKPFEACWGGDTISFNLAWLGKTWPGRVTQVELDALLIHEFAHHLMDDHFSDKYIHACCSLGAKLRTFGETLR